jgi:erythromycin esterase
MADVNVGMSLTEEVPMRSSRSRRFRSPRRWPAALTVVAGLSALVAAACLPIGASAAPHGGGRGVVGWIDRHASPITSTDPQASLHDLRPLSGVVGRATVVGLGESTHGSREQFRLKHRMVRFLVEEMGFRTVAFEDDFASGVAIDRYVVTGEGDPRQLLAGSSSPFWATEEILDLVTWMRSYNETHADKVRFLGTDLLQLRQVSFDTVVDHVRSVAPERLAELEGLLAELEPRDDQFDWYDTVPDPEKQELIDMAQRAVDLVESLPATGGSLDHEYAVQHARAIHGWYVNYRSETEFRAYREVFIADSIQWWQRLTGHEVTYWAASVHTSSAPQLTHRNLWAEQTGTMAGGHLESRLGRRYVSIGTLFFEGSITSNFAQLASHRIGPPPPALLEATLGAAARPTYLLPLRAPAPRDVRAWLDGEATSYMIFPAYVEGHDAAAYNMTVPSLREAFDAVVFTRQTTASRLLPR